MAFANEQLQEIEKAAAKFMSSKRPWEEIIKELDLGYRIEGHSIFVYKIMPQWNNRVIIRYFDFAKKPTMYWPKMFGKCIGCGVA